MNYRGLFDINGKVAVVTGGAGLIGRELVRGLAEAGAATVLADIDKEKGKAIEKRLQKDGLESVFCHLDITGTDSLLELIDFVTERYGGVDIWVNSAYPRTSDWATKFERVSLESWRQNIDMHLNGYFLCCQKAAEHMKKKRAGSIINIASIYGLVGPDFSIYQSTKMTMPAAYSAIKGGIISFTRYLASYYGKYNIRINCVSPGGIQSRQPQAFVRRYKNKTPLRRMAKTEDIVGAVRYLASDASAYVTGHNLVVDGGWSII